MKKIYVTQIEHDCDIDPEVVITTRPFTNEEKKNIMQNLEQYKEKNDDWESDQTALMDYAVFHPFKSIVRPFEFDSIQNID